MSKKLSDSESNASKLSDNLENLEAQIKDEVYGSAEAAKLKKIMEDDYMKLQM